MSQQASCFNCSKYSYGIGVTCGVTIEYNGKQFYVRVSPENSPKTSKAGMLLQRLDKVIELGSIKDENLVLEQIASLICTTGRTLFLSLAPLSEYNHAENLTLEIFLSPKKFYLQLLSLSDQVQLVELENRPVGNQMVAIRPVETDLPKFSAGEILVLKKLGGINVLKVLVDGVERLCKVTIDGESRAVQREFECLNKVMTVDRSVIRVPKLIGLVQKSSGDGIFGIIEEYISPRPSNEFQPTLEGFKSGMSSIPLDRKQKWAAQIRTTLEFLHQNGIIWGDAKADNIMIDSNDDAWVIDFGGSWTEGWVDQHLAETLEGDLMGWQKIEKFLGLDEMSPSEVVELPLQK